jgi:hypothetical protein
MTVAFLYRKTHRALMPLSFLSPPKRLRAWTQRSVCCSRLPMKPSKMVSPPMFRGPLEERYAETSTLGGIPIDTLPGSNTAVYSGSMTNDYELLSTRDIYDMPHNSATGNGRTMLANRLSWFFDLQGPSIMMDTACSSSLTAVHLAAQALRSGECGMVSNAIVIKKSFIDTN